MSNCGHGGGGAAAAARQRSRAERWRYAVRVRRRAPFIHSRTRNSYYVVSARVLFGICYRTTVMSVKMNNVSQLLESEGTTEERNTRETIAVTSVHHDVSTIALPSGLVGHLDANWEAGKPLSDGVVANFGTPTLRGSKFPKFSFFPADMQGNLQRGDKSTAPKFASIAHTFMTEVPKQFVEILTNVAHLTLLLKQKCHAYDQHRVMVCPTNRARAESRKSEQYCCRDEELWTITVLLFDVLGRNVESDLKECVARTHHVFLDSIPKLLHAATQYCLLTSFHDNKALAVEMLQRVGCNFGVRKRLRMLVAIEMGSKYDASIVRILQLKQQAQILVGNRRNAMVLGKGDVTDDSDEAEEDEETKAEREEDEELTRDCGQELISEAEMELNKKHGVITEGKEGDIVSGGRFTVFNGQKTHSFVFGPHMLKSSRDLLTWSAIAYAPISGLPQETYQTDRSGRTGQEPLNEFKEGLVSLINSFFFHLYPTEELQGRFVTNFRNINGNGVGTKGRLFAGACPWKMEFIDDTNHPNEIHKNVTIFMQ